MTLDFSRTALVVVDMQYGDAHRDYGLLKDKRAAGQLEAVERYARRLDDLVVPNIQRLLAAFRDNRGEVVFIHIESLTRDGRDRGPVVDRLGAPQGSQADLRRRLGGARAGAGHARLGHRRRRLYLGRDHHLRNGRKRP